MTIFCQNSGFCSTAQPGCHWEQNHMEKPTCRNSWSCYRRQPSANVEITAYGLLANMRRGNDLSDQICIAKWLAGQRNSYGGFSSTQVLARMNLFLLLQYYDGMIVMIDPLLFVAKNVKNVNYFHVLLFGHSSVTFR